MLQSLRDKTKGIVAIFVVGLLTIPLALVGVEQLLYNSGHSSYGDVAEVNGRVISEQELQIALQRERARLQAQLGDNLPASFFSNETLRAPVMESLINRAALATLSSESNMAVSDTEVDEIIVGIPDFQRDGAFDQTRFINSVRRLGLTPTGFREQLKEDILVSQVRDSVVDTAFMTQLEIENSVSLSRQTRDFEWLTLPLGDLAESASVSDQEVSDFYEQNQQDYLTQEEVAVEYLLLDIADIEADITVDESELLERYEVEKDSLIAAQAREAAHIMISGEGDEVADKVEEVQSRLAEGEDFGALALEFSEDFGSRDNGGNLGVSTGDSFPEEFETALQGLTQAGEIADPITVDGNTHIIKLISMSDSEPPTFEDERLRIESDIITQRAEERYITDLEQLKDLSYNAETLSEVAEVMGLTVQQTDLFTQLGSEEELLQDSRVLTAAFSDRVIREGYSSDVIELADNRSLVIKKTAHNPVRTLTLDEKREDIIVELKQQKAEAQLAEQAESLRQRVEAGESLTVLAEEQGLILNTQQGAERNEAQVPSELLEYVFELSHPKTGSVSLGGVSLDNGDYALLSLSNVTNGSVDNLTDNERQSLQVNMSASLAGDSFRVWQESLRDNAEVEVYETAAN